MAGTPPPDAPLRLFVALRPSEPRRDALAREGRRVARAAPAARPVTAENVHMTIAFLGATAPREVEALGRAFARVVAAHRAVSWAPAGLGATPDRRRPRVVWAEVGAGEGRDALVALAADVGRAASEAGHPAEGADRFRPHLTLARLDPRDATPALEELLTAGCLQDTYKPEVTSDLALMVSENDGRGVRYRVVDRYPLAPSTGAASHGVPGEAGRPA